MWRLSEIDTKLHMLEPKDTVKSLYCYCEAHGWNKRRKSIFLRSPYRGIARFYLFPRRT